MDVLILDSTNEDFGKHAYSQLTEFDIEVKVEEVDLLDIPGEIGRSSAENFLVIADKSEDFIDQVVDKIIEVEMKRGFVEKVFLKSENESEEAFNRRGRRESGEAAERLAKKIR